MKKSIYLLLTIILLFLFFASCRSKYSLKGSVREKTEAGEEYIDSGVNIPGRNQEVL